MGINVDPLYQNVEPGDTFSIYHPTKNHGRIRIYVPDEETKQFKSDCEIHVDDLPITHMGGSFNIMHSPEDHLTVAFWIALEDIDPLIEVLAKAKRTLAQLWDEQAAREKAMRDTFCPTEGVD